MRRSGIVGSSRSTPAKVNPRCVCEGEAEKLRPKPALAPFLTPPVSNARSGEFGLSGMEPLSHSRPEGALEQEADRVADRIAHAPSPSIRALSSHSMQRAAVPNAARTAPSGDLGFPDAGRSLDETTRAFFEPRLGHDFSRVRVHTGCDAQASARDLKAKAYTIGQDIVFGANRFAPSSGEGRRLLAHELTHVVQQSGGAARARGPVTHSAPIGIARSPDTTEEEEEAEYRRQTQEDKRGRRRGHRRGAEPLPPTGGQVSRQAAGDIQSMVRHAEEGGYQHVNTAKRQRATAKFRKLLDRYRGTEIQRIDEQLKTATGTDREELVRQKRAIVAERVWWQGQFDEAMRTPAGADVQRHYVRGGAARPYHETRAGIGGYAQPDYSITKSTAQGNVWYHVNLKSHNLKDITPADARAVAREVTAQAIRNATGDPTRRGHVGHLPAGERIIISFIDMPDETIRNEMSRIMLSGDSPIEEARFGTATHRRVVRPPAPPATGRTSGGSAPGTSGRPQAPTGHTGGGSNLPKGSVFETGTQSTLPKGSAFDNPGASPLPKGSIFNLRTSFTPGASPDPNVSRQSTAAALPKGAALLGPPRAPVATSTPIDQPAGTSMKTGRVVVDIDTGGPDARPIKRLDIDVSDFPPGREQKAVPGLSKTATAGSLAVTMASLIGEAAGGETQEKIEKVIAPIESHFKGVLQEARLEFHSAFPDPAPMWADAGIDELGKTYGLAMTKLKSPQHARMATAVLLALTPEDRRDATWHKMAEMVKNKSVGIRPADLRAFIEARDAYEAGMVELLKRLQPYRQSPLSDISADVRRRANLLLSVGNDLQDTFWKLMSSPLAAVPLVYYELWSIYSVAGTFLDLGGRMGSFAAEIEGRAASYERMSSSLDATLTEVGNRHPF